MKWLIQIPGKPDKILDSEKVNMIIVSDKVEALGGTCNKIN